MVDIAADEVTQLLGEHDLKATRLMRRWVFNVIAQGRLVDAAELNENVPMLLGQEDKLETFVSRHCNFSRGGR